MTTHEALRAAAEKATPGPYDVNPATTVDGESMVCAGGGHGYGLVAVALTAEDAAFQALANPAQIIALLDEREAVIEALRGDLWTSGSDDPVTMARMVRRALDRSALRTADALSRVERLEERLQAIIDWTDLAMANPAEFDSHGVRNLDGPVFDEARAALSEKGQG